MEPKNIISFELDRFIGANVKYTVIDDNGDEEFSVKLARPAHVDLTDILQGAFGDWVRFMLGFPEDCADIVRTSGVSFPKDGYIQFSAYVKGPSGEYKVKTPKVRIPAEKDEAVMFLRDEICQYIDGKTSQLSLFGEDNTPEDLLAEAEAE